MAHGAPVDPTSLAKRLMSLGISIPPDQLPELIPTILQIFGRRNDVHIHLPAVLSDVVEKLLQGRAAKTLCDPWPGIGTMLAIAQCATSSPRCIAFNLNASEGELAKALFPQAEWSIGQPLKLLSELKDPIDVFVSCLPFNARTNESVPPTSFL